MDEEAIALRIGRVVLACARIEFQLVLMATELGVKNAKKQSQGNLIKLIRQRCGKWSESAEVNEWLGKANALLEERGMLVHGSFTAFLSASGSYEGFFAHKSFKEANVELDHLDRLVQDARSAADQAEELTWRRFERFTETLGDSYIPD